MPGVLPPRPLGVVSVIVHLFTHTKRCVSFRVHVLYFGCVTAAWSSSVSHSIPSPLVPVKQLLLIIQLF
jgi:hypothetical protein